MTHSENGTGNGSEISESDVDGLLWLYDDRPLTPEESLLTPPPAGFEHRQYTPDDFRRLVVDLIGRVMNFVTEAHSARAHILFEFGDEARIAGSRRLAKLEAEPGVLLLLLRDISPLLYLPESGDILRLKPTQRPFTAEHHKRQWEGLQMERNVRALSDIKRFGLRCIHSRQALIDYFAGHSNHAFTSEERQAHLAHWINLATTHYPDLEIGLVEESPRIEVEIKSTKGAVIRGTAADSSSTGSSWGTRYIFFDDKRDGVSALSFLWDFERQWLEIPAEMRGCGVIEFLKGLIE